MAKFKVAVIIGSNRRESVNRRLGHALTKLGADKFAFSFIQIDDLPLYNQDLEAELPNTVARFCRAHRPSPLTGLSNDRPSLVSS